MEMKNNNSTFDEIGWDDGRYDFDGLDLKEPEVLYLLERRESDGDHDDYGSLSP
jgi:hypothetical protein